MVVAAAFAAATWLLGWWAVPVLALIAGALRATWAPWLVGSGAGLGWLGMILASDRDGSLGRLLGRLGALLGVPGWTILALAVGFAALLGWSGARLGAQMGSRA
jgi:hypothetical protein